MIKTYFNGKPCEVLKHGVDSEVLIRHASDDPLWPFPSYTWVKAKLVTKTKVSKQSEALQGIEDALMQVGVTLAQIVASSPLKTRLKGIL